MSEAVLSSAARGWRLVQSCSGAPVGDGHVQHDVVLVHGDHRLGVHGVRQAGQLQHAVEARGGGGSGLRVARGAGQV